MTAELKKYFDLSPKDRREIISLAATETGGEEKILEKDVMVVWILDTVFRSPFGDALSFKGGTSLSKVYQLINRFSEDVDLTYDIRKFLPGMAYDHDGIPPSNSQQRKLTAAVREKLPAWIEGELARLLTKAISDQGLSATLRQNTAETLNIDYPSLFEGHTYVRPSVLLEFGARSTGSPRQTDAAAVSNGIDFPAASVRAMAVERTFWEKATAAHVYCMQENMKKDRFSRHRHDLHYIHRSEYFDAALKDKELSEKVARHKSFFFAEKDKHGEYIDYVGAVKTGLKLVPSKDARSVLAEDYVLMKESGVTAPDSPSFDEIMETCSKIESSFSVK